MKKHILFLSPSLSIGGAERVLVNLLKKLDGNRYEITLCLFGNYGAYLKEIPDHVKVISIFNSSFLARVFTFIQRKFRLTSLLKKIVLSKITNTYDIGICFSDGLLTDVLTMLENKVNKKITWVHSCYKSQKDLEHVYVDDYNKKLIETRYKKMDGIVFVSKQSKLEFEELFGDVSNRVIISNIFDAQTIIQKSNDPFHDLLESNGDVHLIAIGRLVEVKEYSKLIKAIDILIKKNIKLKLSILGDGPLKKQLQDQINNLQLQDYVKLKGFVSNPYPYLKSSDIFVLSSSSEALPTVLIEAMVLGVPIVSTCCSGANEITDNGDYALLSNHSVADLADKIEIMIQDKNLRNHYAIKARKRVDNYNEIEILGQIDNLLN